MSSRPPHTSLQADIFGGAPWQERLAHILDTMRDLSRIQDPQQLVTTYRQRLGDVSRMDGFLSITRRGVEAPGYLVARSSLWEREGRHVDPWLQRDELPHLEGGLLGELLYANEARLIDEIELAPDEPARPWLDGMRSLAAIPVFDGGESLNMVIQLRRAPNAFPPDNLPQMVWLTNLFSRGTHGLVLARELSRAHAELAAEQAQVGELQRSLLPDACPHIDGLDLAAHYRPSGRAGGDYYDFFCLQDGRWGVLLADVSGHGSHAAVLMAVTHALVHQHDAPKHDPVALLAHLDRQLSARYTTDGSTFVTALYGVYCPETRTFRHALAGHPAPRVARSDGSVVATCARTGLALGIEGDSAYEESTLCLETGDRVLLYTDGLTEARSPAGELLGSDPVDALLADEALDAADLVGRLVGTAHEHAGPGGVQDDLSLLALRVRP